MKLSVDDTLCQQLHQCTFAAPDVFRVDDDTDRMTFDPNPVDELSSDIDEAVIGCPMQAIVVVG